MAETAPDRTQAAFAALEAALPDSRIAFKVDLRKLCHPHSPVPVDYLKNQVVYVYLGLCVIVGGALVAFKFDRSILWWSLGILTAVYWIGIRPIFEAYIRKRIVSYIMEEPGRMEKVWRYGGVTLVGTNGERVVAPQDDWRSFVLQPRT